MGTHSMEQKNTCRKIVNNGACGYKVIIPKEPSEWEKRAAEEFVYFFKQATGIELEVVDDETVKFVPWRGLFSIGNTKAIARTEIFEGQIKIEPEVLKSNGARVVTYGATVFMYGATGLGTLYAVYEYLKIAFHFDYFFKDAYYIDRNVFNLPFVELDVTEVPDIETRAASYGCIAKDEKYYRSRLQKDFRMGIDGTFGHNSLKWLNPEKNLAEHPAWFDRAETPTQPCFTAHGNKKEYALMLKQCFASLQTAMKEYPERNIVVFGTEDLETSCECPACKRLRKKYGTDAASEVIFLNALKKKADEWMASADGKPYARDLQIQFMAYLNYLGAPTIKDETTGAYKPKDERVRCEKGIVPIICFIEATYSHSFYEEKNAKWAEITKQWSACAENMAFGYYDTNFHYMLAPIDTFSSMKDHYRYAVENGAVYMCNMGQYKNIHPTGFSKLKSYLQTKIGWDVNVDLEAYTDKYFDFSYGAASEDMHKFYCSYLEQAKKIHGELKFAERRNCECYGNPLERKYWPEKLLNEWLGYTKSALEKIKPLIETDIKQYLFYVTNIVCERIFPSYLLAELYSDSYDEETLEQLKKTVKNDCEFAQIASTAEGGSSGIWAIWGV